LEGNGGEGLEKKEGVSRKIEDIERRVLGGLFFFKI